MTSRARLARVLRTLTLAVVIGSSQVVTAADQPLATYTLSPGWATFGLALPQGAAPKAVQVGTVPTQTDVKVRWPDDSIRFAVVSANLGANERQLRHHTCAAAAGDLRAGAAEGRRQLQRSATCR